jgi:hypothetical protein
LKKLKADGSRSETDDKNPENESRSCPKSQLRWDTGMGLCESRCDMQSEKIHKDSGIRTKFHKCTIQLDKRISFLTIRIVTS